MHDPVLYGLYVCSNVVSVCLWHFCGECGVCMVWVVISGGCVFLCALGVGYVLGLYYICHACMLHL